MKLIIIRINSRKDHLHSGQHLFFMHVQDVKTSLVWHQGPQRPLPTHARVHTSRKNCRRVQNPASHELSSVTRSLAQEGIPTSRTEDPIGAGVERAGMLRWEGVQGCLTDSLIPWLKHKSADISVEQLHTADDDDGLLLAKTHINLPMETSNGKKKKEKKGAATPPNRREIHPLLI